MSDLEVAEGRAHPFAIATIRIGDLPRFPMVVNARDDQFIGPHLIECGHWELLESTLLTRLIQPGWRVVDVGANIGYYTLLAARRAGAAGEVWAFEPEPANFRLLAANVALNGCAQVALMQAAAGARRARLPLRLASANLGDHRLSLAAAPDDGRASIEVEVVALDDCLPDQDVHLVKIDTQGAELEVLAGMRRLIERNRERLVLMIEFAPGLLAEAGRSVGDFVAALNSFGGQAFTVEREGEALRIVPASSVASVCDRLSATLAAQAGQDASADLFVCFSSAALQSQLRHLAGQTA